MRLFQTVWEPPEIVEHLMEEWECLLNLMHTPPSSEEGWGCQIFIRTIFSRWVVHENSFAILVMVEPEHETCAGDHYSKKETAFTLHASSVNSASFC